MIPADLAARLRLLTEASFFNTEPPVPGLQRAREIQSQLPDLLPGQRFTAALQRTLPDGSFQAVVAGRQITLALPHAAQAGDTLELVVTQVTPRAVFAQAADTASSAAAPRADLSPTGRLISFLLTGQPAAQAPVLNGGQPLLPNPPANGSPLAPLLRQALGQSGLFYESQQARWLGGKVDTADLLRQPQSQLQAQGGSGASATATPAGSAAAHAQGAERSAARGGNSPLPADNAPPPRLAALPERLLPVVHQQLDALATQQYIVHAQAWPGQHFEWQIEDPGGDGEGDGSGDSPEWRTTLRLTLPRLGGVDAHLHLGAGGIALRLVTDDKTSAADLEAGREALATRLQAAGLALNGMVVEVRDEA